MERYPVGTRVSWEGRNATVKEVDVNDEILPYYVEYDDGGLDWVGPVEKADEIIFAIRESDLEGVEINADLPSGKIQADGWVVFDFETPADLRERIAYNREEIIACEAAARFKEGLSSAPTDRQIEVANTIYNKPFTELDESYKTVVNRVVDNYYGKDN